MHRFFLILTLALSAPLIAGSTDFAPFGKGSKPVEAKPISKLPVVVRTDTDEPIRRLPVKDDPPVIPTISLPEEYESSMGVVLLKASVSDPAMISGLLWESPDDLQFHNDVVVLQPGAIFATAKSPGQKKIRVIGALANQPCLSNWCSITVQGPQPQPPNPNPPTPPNPQPPGPTPPAPITKAAALNIIFVYDPNDPATSAGLLQLLKDPIFGVGTGPLVAQNALFRKGHKVFPVMLNGTEGGQPVQQRYAAQLKAAGKVPCVILLDRKDGTWVNTDDLAVPANAASIRTFLAKYTDNL